ncbi:sulfate ABC transporter ATP-binding protein [Acinetobacter portensis]|uniref:Sulfate ABC transporter ATP-binding protein n=2 Tax=Acinetobacter TaxID=469 RepID=A0AB35V067_9GAMM|nr:MULTISPECIES: sulfate ABC transporter ATP-binding protein [Acinetobacter]MCK7609981.1 sulfate ABC transporter ATP-binding protein [Acinetobacter portensis]MCK7640760.1 sulfate ABC transporter ATP-binding protein [Acinetobacter portensis]MDY6459208.1 sulfate ABC transporter ATP-binding protein [Acinetobacter faecalis]MDY6485289.1 sulfate ABC transporter ATP-binding protein [Acinetobacter faecalis]MDY6487643.1 sulfate ABC transporter ATP-binding protein [Acinetobacter faecalis]
MSIQVKNIEKHFGAFHALNNISLDFPDGQLVALLGPSGCGKTTLLRIIAGLESADGGQVILEGEDATNVHVREREVGFVFQHYALFRHMTVFDNIAFGLRVRPRATRPSEAEIKKRVTRLLDLVQLGFLADRYPAQLSGGQRQRIALARALAVEPRVLLLDEPFGALDAKVRKELRRWLRTLHDELHITSIFVTHDQEEALEVADQIIVMNKGNVEQIGSPREVYEKPATPFVFDFLGQANRFEGHNQNGVIQIGEDRIQLDSLNKAPEGSVIAFARPDELRIHAQPQDNAIQATFIREVWIAGKVIAELNDRQGNLIEITLTPDEAKRHQFRPNQTVWLSATALHLFENQVA